MIKLSQAVIAAVIALLVGFGLGLTVRSTPAPVEHAETPMQPLNAPQLAQMGNASYDRKDYAKAIDYYQASLKLEPENVRVRTDLGTALFYSGNPEAALREYDTALKIQPDFAQTLMNVGVVKLHGKQDKKGAIEAWKRLLAVHPDFPDRAKVEEMIQRAEIGEMMQDIKKK
jgi:tetratricopeptide (TPR) repeat protein